MGETSLITLLKIMQQRAKHKEIATGVGYNYIAGCLLDYPYSIENIYQVLLDILNIIEKEFLFLRK